MDEIAWNRMGEGLLDELLPERSGEASDVPPDLGDRYHIEGLLGRGGQGVVYRVHDRSIDRQLAIKCGNASVLAEARLLGQLAHPAIPQVHDYGRLPDGRHFLIMELIEGRRLDKYLEAEPTDIKARLAIFHRIAEAVDHAHNRGIIHRDLKPGNIIVRPDSLPCLLDWGLAATGDPRAVCGSPHFAAPEQLDGQPADRRSDIYALGVLLYVIISNELPYARAVTDFNEFRNVRAGLQRIPLHRRRPEVPRGLGRVCDRAMAAHAAVRFTDINELRSTIDRVMQQSEPSHRRRIATLAVLLFLIALAWLVGRKHSTLVEIWTWMLGPPEPQEQTPSPTDSRPPSNGWSGLKDRQKPLLPEKGEP